MTIDELLSVCESAVSLEGTEGECSRHELYSLVKELAEAYAEQKAKKSVGFSV